MIKLALKRPVATSIIFLIALAFSLFAIQNIQVDLMPETELPYVNVTTFWHNTSPEVIQKEITTPIEEIAGRIPSVRDIESESSHGSSSIKITFEKNAHVDFATFQLKEELAVLRQSLPRNIIGPEVKAVLPDEANQNQKTFFSFEVSGDASVQEVREFVEKEVEPRFSAIDGVASLLVSGGSRKNIILELEREQLKLLDIDSSMIQSAVSELDIKYPAQPLVFNESQSIILVDNSAVSLEDILNLPVIMKGSRIIRVRDIGTVSRGYEELYSLSRVNGKPTVTIVVTKTRTANTVSAAERCVSMVNFLNVRFPETTFKILENGGQDIMDELTHLAKRGGVIFLLIFISLSLFLLSLRTPLVIILSIILSSIITIDLFYLFNISINFVTLSGLAMGFGMMVDNSIVVAESIIEKIDMGLERTTAILKGTADVSGSITASTLTTVGGFFSFVFLSGRMADYYMPLAFAISFSLTASLFVAFTLIPMVFRFATLRSVRKNLFNFTFLKAPLKLSKKAFIIPMIVLIALGVHSFQRFSKDVSRGGFFSFRDNKTLSIYVRMKAESDIETVDDTLKGFEHKLLATPGIENCVLTVRKSSGSINVTFKDDIKNTYIPFQIKSDMIAIASQLAGISIGVSGLDQDGYYSSPGGGGGYMNSSITITGYSFDKVKDIAESVTQKVLKERRISDAEVTYSTSWWGNQAQDEMLIHFKEDVLKNHNISKSRLIGFIGKNLQIDMKNRIKLKGEDTDFEIRFSDFSGMEKDEFLGLKFKTVDGSLFRLGDLITFGKYKASGMISKKNQKYVALAKWDYKGSSKRRSRFQKKVFEELELPPGYTKEMDDTFMTDEEEKMIYKSYAIALVVIYLILAAYFESMLLPFAVLLSVPFALIGVFYIFYIGDYSFDAAAYMGLILLFGIVVNNSILYIDTYRQEKDSVKASLRRARPILLTTLTTIAGMLPLILMQNEDGASTQQIWVSLGIATTGGLASSAVMIILFMPACLEVFERISLRLSELGNACMAGSAKVFGNSDQK